MLGPARLSETQEPSIWRQLPAPAAGFAPEQVMAVRLGWVGGEPPAWLAAMNDVSIVSIPAGDAKRLLGLSSTARAVVLDCAVPSAFQAAALLSAAHIPVLAIGEPPRLAARGPAPIGRYVDNARDLKDFLDAMPPLPAAFRFMSDGEAKEGISGRVVSGRPQPDLRIAILPEGTGATIVSLKADNETGKTVLTIDPRLHVPPGSLLTEADDRPEVTDQIAAHIVWLDSGGPMLPGRPYNLELAGQKVIATITALKYRLNPETQEHIAARSLAHGEIGFCNLSFERPLAVEPASRRTGLGSFAISDVASGRPLARGFVEFGLRRATNVHWQALSIDRGARALLKGQRPCCLWFTGLSGSGKSTVASLLEKRLHALGRHTYVLDGDNVRHGLNRDLGFTDADRVENIRRVAEVAKLMADAGLIVVVSFISPFRAERRLARALFKDGEFLEVFLDTPLEVCEARDPKGLYKKARAGLIKNFTGIDSAYEQPEAPDLRLQSGNELAEILVDKIISTLRKRGVIAATEKPHQIGC
ncbi:MAG: adenylyl-sulfate kinase [Hyphomicrobiaceae bacterium]|nr:MAG: adenylyl-sulfate kinase [Hyphomicrobiaceae bacterium]